MWKKNLVTISAIFYKEKTALVRKCAPRAMESISAADCVHISPVSTSIAFGINRAGMKMIYKKKRFINGIIQTVMFLTVWVMPLYFMHMG